MELSRSLVGPYTRDENGPLPMRAVSRQIQDISSELSKDIHKKPRVIILSGLRGVGKTTILFQTIRHLLENGMKEDDVVFISMDRASFSGKNIRDLVGEYERNIVRGGLISTQRGIIFMIDEAQYSQKWDLQIKTLTDEAPNVVFIVTGSSALELSISPDLSRRSLSISVEPLNYLEYLQIRSRKGELVGMESDAMIRIMRAEDATSALDIFESKMENIRKQLRHLGGHSPGALDDYILYGGLPFSIGHRDSGQQLYDMIRRVIEKDVPLIGEHDSRILRSIPVLIGMLAPSPDISLNSISRDIDGLSISSVRAVLDTLKKCRLIFEVEKVGSPRSSLRSDTRKYFSSSCLASSVLSSMGRDPRQYMGQLVETSVASLIRTGTSEASSMSLRYKKGKGMADLVVQEIDQSVSIEIGSGRKGGGPVQLRKTMRETSSKFGILICDVKRAELNRDILKIPLKEFLCL